jgi:hypothetical protein
MLHWLTIAVSWHYHHGSLTVATHRIVCRFGAPTPAAHRTQVREPQLFFERKKMVSKVLLRQTDALEQFVKIQPSNEIKFALFLEYLMESGDVADAAREADIPLSTTRAMRRKDPRCQEAFKEALDIGTDAIESELHRRAVKGYLEPIFYKGRRVNTVRKKSDILLMFLLKSRRPHLYRDSAPIPVDPDNTDDADFADISPAEKIASRLAQLAERKREK